MAYFDNAATTYPKPEPVYAFMDQFYRNSGGSAGRGQYEQSVLANNLIEETRDVLKGVLKCPSKQIIFEPTATIALNIIIQGMIAKGAKNIYISPFEHNAVTRVLHNYEKTGQIKVIQLYVSKSLEYDLNRIEYQFDEIRPDFVIVSHASNVIGLVAPVEDIFKLAKKYNAVTLLDMAQTAGLIDINVGLETIDFAVFAGHKTLMGPTGISGFAMNPDLQPEPILFGGTGFDSANQDMPNSLPEKYEMGTLNTLGIAGLNAAVKWIEKETISSIYEKEIENRNRLKALLTNYDFISLIGCSDEQKYVGIVSCLIRGISSDSAGPVFSEHGISVRTGLQCAPLAHKWLGTYPSGTIRFSVNTFTSENDFQELEVLLDEIENNC